MSDRKPGYLRRRVVKMYRQLIGLKGPPRGIALGFAIGVFFAFSPFIGFHTVLVVMLCIALRANMPAGFVASSLANPITFPLILYGDYEIGRLLISCPKVHLGWEELTWEALRQQVPNLLLPMVAGSILIGILFSVLSYFLVRKALVRYRKGGKTAVASERSP